MTDVKSGEPIARSAEKGSRSAAADSPSGGALAVLLGGLEVRHGGLEVPRAYDDKVARHEKLVATRERNHTLGKRQKEAQADQPAPPTPPKA